MNGILWLKKNMRLIKANSWSDFKVKLHRHVIDVKVHTYELSFLCFSLLNFVSNSHWFAAK